MSDESSTNISQEISLEGNNEINEEPTYKEVTEIISSLKNNKSPGSDNIVNGLIKVVGHSLWTRIYELIMKIWNTEQMLNEWKEGIICPIFKKENKKDCNNYRAISLLNTTYKRFTTILYKRISKYAEQRIGEYQTDLDPINQQ